MKKKFLLLTTFIALSGAFVSTINSSRAYNVPCDGLETPTFKKKFIGTLWCREGGRDCIKCK